MLIPRSGTEDFFAKLKVSTLGGQSLFVNEFTSNSNGGKLGLTGQPLGDIIKSRFHRYKTYTFNQDLILLLLSA
jgi:uncharacterized protein (AIM24 family)